ncbi:MAG: hypothetical protein ABSG50_07270 [Opitutaceae bacterium]|jgi:hypothetical protein
MKTPTLIVRLVGLYLLATCPVALFQIQKVHALAGASTLQDNLVGVFQFYAWLGLVVGLAATLFAGPLARLLTFDSEPRDKSADLSDQLLERKDKNA